MFDPRKIPSYFYHRNGDGSSIWTDPAEDKESSDKNRRRPPTADTRHHHKENPVLLEVNPGSVLRTARLIRRGDGEEEIENDDENKFSVNLDDPQPNEDKEDDKDDNKFWRSTLVISWTKGRDDPRQIPVPGGFIIKSLNGFFLFVSITFCPRTTHSPLLFTR
jgi:hypothetical protein